MKTLLTVTLVSMMIISGIYGQTSGTLHRTRYGLELNQFITGSGFASGTEIYFTVIPDHKKNISLGLYFCPELKRITGITIHHERVIGKYAIHKMIVPYAFYNLIYRRTRSKEVLANKDFGDYYVTYKSIEHHLGIGIRISMAKNVYFNSSLGYGVYLGSIKKPSEPDPLSGEVTGKNGFGAIAKVGFAYTF
jgi:hypothetical protein